MTRVSVPLRDELKREIADHPDGLGLDASLSEAQRVAQLVEEGAAARRAAQRDALRAEVYAVFAADPAHEESIRELADAAFKHDLI